jgi:hypothetical protein
MKKSDFKKLIKKLMMNGLAGVVLTSASTISSAQAEIPACLTKRFPWALDLVPDMTETNLLPTYVCTEKSPKKTEFQKFTESVNSQVQFQHAFAYQGLKDTLNSALNFKIQTETKANLNTLTKRKQWFNQMIGQGKRNIYLPQDHYDRLYHELFDAKPSAYSEMLNEWSAKQQDPSFEILRNDVRMVGRDMQQSYSQLLLDQKKHDQQLKNRPIRLGSDLQRLLQAVKANPQDPVAQKNLADYQKNQLKPVDVQQSEKNNFDERWRTKVWGWYDSYPAVFTLMNTQAVKDEWLTMPMRFELSPQVSRFETLDQALDDHTLQFKNLNNAQANAVLVRAMNEANTSYQNRAKKYQDLGIVGNSIWKANPNSISERSVDLADLALRDPSNFIRTTLAMPAGYNFTELCKAFTEAESRIQTKEERAKWIAGVNNVLLVAGVAAMIASGVGSVGGIAALTRIVSNSTLTATLTIADDVSMMANMMNSEPERRRIQADLSVLHQQLLDRNDPDLMQRYRAQASKQSLDQLTNTAVSLIPMANDVLLLKNILKAK